MISEEELFRKQQLDLLKQILRAICLQVGSEKSLTERAKLLKLAGLDNRTIAEVLNTSDAAIRVLTKRQLVKHNKKGRKA